MKNASTRLLAVLLCPVLLLASCATSQKFTSPTSETSVTDAPSLVRERETGFPGEAWTYYETYYGKKTAERLLQKEIEPEHVQVAQPQEPDSEEPDDQTTLGDVAVGALKVLGTILLVAILLAGSAGAGFAGGGW